MATTPRWASATACTMDSLSPSPSAAADAIVFEAAERLAQAVDSVRRDRGAGVAHRQGLSAGHELGADHEMLNGICVAPDKSAPGLSPREGGQAGGGGALHTAQL